MQGGFNKCPNGHYYQGVTCPYCPQQVTTGDSSTQTLDNEAKTQIYGGVGNTSTQGTVTKTQIIDGFGSGNTSTIADNSSTASQGGRSGRQGANNADSHTVFGDEVEVETPAGEIKTEKQYRSARRLVGWLVTYSFDKMGIDFKLYEGRNIIGRDADCSITINDRMVSGKHAILLFRADKYSITDSQSAHGTFVNDEDIELEPRYLKDGDVIRMGETVFKFRTSLF
jgi:hypothetical protein